MSSAHSECLGNLPDDVLLTIAKFVGEKDSYLGLGAVNRRLNQLYKSYNLPKESSFAGYASFKAIMNKFYSEIHKEVYILWGEMCKLVANGVVSYNRSDLLEWSMSDKAGVKYPILVETIFGIAAEAGKSIVFFREKLLNDKNVILLNKLKETTLLSEMAARFGRLDLIQYLQNEGFPWGSSTCRYAAQRGSLECLKYLHEHGCGWNDACCSFAARKGNLECLKYLHENGCAIDVSWTCRMAARAARKGDPGCLKYLRDIGIQWDEYDFYLDNTD